MTVRLRRHMELDYTYCAQPGEWDLVQIEREITECYSKFMEPPEKIVLWEHQWAWLTRHIDHRDPETVAAYVAEHGALGYNCIFGVPVEVKS